MQGGAGGAGSLSLKIAATQPADEQDHDSATPAFHIIHVDILQAEEWKNIRKKKENTSVHSACIRRASGAPLCDLLGLDLKPNRKLLNKIKYMNNLYYHCIRMKSVK